MTSPPASAHAKLTWGHVNRIRDLARDPAMSFVKLAALFDIAPSTVAHIIDGTTWKQRGYVPPKRKPRAKLTWPMVREIRRRYAQGETGRVLAAEFGVSGVTIHFVITGRNWQHDPDGFIYVPEPMMRGSRPRLTPDQVRAIIANVKRATNVQLAMQFEVSEQLIGRIRKGTYRRAA